MESSQTNTDKIIFRQLAKTEINRDLFSTFIRRQVVDKCWRKVNGHWEIIDSPFIDDWTQEQFNFGIKCLQKTVRTGGLVLGAFINGELKGFVSMEKSQENSGLNAKIAHSSLRDPPRMDAPNVKNEWR